MNNSIAFPSDDEQLVQEFERKLQIIRDRVSSVVHNYHTADCHDGTSHRLKHDAYYTPHWRLDTEFIRHAKECAWRLPVIRRPF